MPSLGYAMAYPFGIAGILLTMLGLRAVFRLDAVAAANSFEERRRGEVAAVETMNVMLRNADLDGRTIGDSGIGGSRRDRVAHDAAGPASGAP